MFLLLNEESSLLKKYSALDFNLKYIKAQNQQEFLKQIFQYQHSTRTVIYVQNKLPTIETSIFIRYGLISNYTVHYIYNNNVTTAKELGKHYTFYNPHTAFDEAAVIAFANQMPPFSTLSYKHIKSMDNILRSLAVPHARILLGSEVETIVQIPTSKSNHIGKPKFHNAIIDEDIFLEDYRVDWKPIHPENEKDAIFDHFFETNLDMKPRRIVSESDWIFLQCFNNIVATSHQSDLPQLKLLFLFLSQYRIDSNIIYLGAFPGTLTFEFIYSIGTIVPPQEIWMYDPAFREEEDRVYGNITIHIRKRTIESVRDLDELTKYTEWLIVISDILPDLPEERDNHVNSNYRLQIDLVKSIFFEFNDKFSMFNSSIKTMVDSDNFLRIAESIEVLQPFYSTDADGTRRGNECRTFTTLKSTDWFFTLSSISRERLLNQYRFSIPTSHLISDMLVAAKTYYRDYFKTEINGFNLHDDFYRNQPKYEEVEGRPNDVCPELNEHKGVIALNTLMNNPSSDQAQFINGIEDFVLMNATFRAIGQTKKYMYKQFNDYTIEPHQVYPFFLRTATTPSLNYFQLGAIFGFPVFSKYGLRTFVYAKFIDKLVCTQCQNYIINPSHQIQDYKRFLNDHHIDFGPAYLESRMRKMQLKGYAYLFGKYPEGAKPSRQITCSPSGHIFLLTYTGLFPNIFYLLYTYLMNASKNLGNGFTSFRSKPCACKIFPEPQDKVWHGTDEIYIALDVVKDLSSRYELDIPTMYVESLKAFVKVNTLKSYLGFEVYSLSR